MLIIREVAKAHTAQPLPPRREARLAAEEARLAAEDARLAEEARLVEEARLAAKEAKLAQSRHRLRLNIPWGRNL